MTRVLTDIQMAAIAQGLDEYAVATDAHNMSGRRLKAVLMGIFGTPDMMSHYCKPINALLLAKYYPGKHQLWATKPRFLGDAEKRERSNMMSEFFPLK